MAIKPFYWTLSGGPPVRAVRIRRRLSKCWALVWFVLVLITYSVFLFGFVSVPAFAYLTWNHAWPQFLFMMGAGAWLTHTSYSSNLAIKDLSVHARRIACAFRGEEDPVETV
jgi:uncharacterized integral membrane protein